MKFPLLSKESVRAYQQDLIPNMVDNDDLEIVSELGHTIIVNKELSAIDD